MPSRRRTVFLAALAVLALAIGAAVALAQYGRGRRARSFREGLPEDRAGVPDWKPDAHFPRDVFTFVRVEYDSIGRRRGWGGWGMWRTDWPDSDLNFSFRLQQLTSLKVNPEPISLRLTDDRLFDYPMIYLIEPGRLVFSDDEAAALRKYLLNGGFLMVDDFWGDSEWDNFHCEMKKVFPEEEHEPFELPLSHEIFQCVYHLREKPQVPNAEAAWWGRERGITWESNHDGDCRTVHYKGIQDRRGRLMAIVCHNTDLGDGWEREGDNEWFFHEFSEKKAYPMGINIVTYAMTH